MRARPAWVLDDHVRGAFAEALVAEAIYDSSRDAELMRPRHPGYDARSDALDMRTDAEAANLLSVDLGDGVESCLEWDAGGRPILAEAATHPGLVVLATSNLRLRRHRADGFVLDGSVKVSGRVWLVPYEVAITARPIWSSRNNAPSRGKYRYLPEEQVAEFEVLG